MSGLFGAKPTYVENVAPRIGTVSIQTSAYGKAIPLLWGRTRISPNLMWYNAFTAIPHTTTTSSGGGGGKGGGGGAVVTSDTSYTYTAACMFGLCAGPIVGIGRIWSGKALTTALKLGFWSMLGDFSQSPWGYLSTAYPAQALAYRGLAYSANSAYDLGTQASFSNLSFEILGPSAVGGIPSAAYPATFDHTTGYLTTAAGRVFKNNQCVHLSYSGGGALPAGLQPNFDYFILTDGGSNTYQLLLNAGDTTIVTFTDNGSGTITVTPFVLDANPKDVLVDYLTNQYFGAGFPSAQLGDWSAMHDYCMAAGVFVSPALVTQEAAADFVTRIAKIAYCGIVFSEGVMKMVPYYDQTITGNGVTFTPNLTPVYALTDNDFQPVGGNDPVTIDRSDQADVYNNFQVAYIDRAAQYNSAVAEYRDQGGVEAYGLRPASPETFEEITDSGVAKWVVSTVAQRTQNVRNIYKFKLPAQYILLEPMDYVTLTESNTNNGLNLVSVRITEIEEDETGMLNVTAEDAPPGVGTTVAYPVQEATGYAHDYNADPGITNPPIWFVAPYVLTDGALELWMGLSGATPDWGGCEVWASDDNTSYKQVGTFFGRSRMGVTTTVLPYHTDPDSDNTLGVNVATSLAALNGGLPFDNITFDMLSYIGPAGGYGELISFFSASQVSPYQFTLSHLRRMVYGSDAAQSLPIGSNYLRVDDAVFKMVFPYIYSGRTLYLKLPAFNTVGSARQALADVSPYTVELTQRYAGLPPVPNVSGLTVINNSGLSGDYGYDPNVTYFLNPSIPYIFSGTDVKFAWRINSQYNSYDIGAEPFGAASGGQDVHFKDYQVNIYVNAGDSTPIRTEYVTSPQYVYSFEKNYEDNQHAPIRTLTVGVRVRGNLNQLSDAEARITVTNPQTSIGASYGVQARANFKSVYIGYIKPSSPDWAGVMVFASLTPGFTPSGTTQGSGNCVYVGTDPLIVLDGSPATTYYLRLATFDTFGTDSLTYSDQITVTTDQVQTADIAGLAVTTGKIGTGEVKSGNIGGSQVLTTHIGTGEVNTGNVANNAITKLWAGTSGLGGGFILTGSYTGSYVPFWINYNINCNVDLELTGDECNYGLMYSPTIQYTNTMGAAWALSASINTIKALPANCANLGSATVTVVSYGGYWTLRFAYGSALPAAVTGTSAADAVLLIPHQAMMYVRGIDAVNNYIYCSPDTAGYNSAFILGSGTYPVTIPASRFVGCPGAGATQVSPGISATVTIPANGSGVAPRISFANAFFDPAYHWIFSLCTSCFPAMVGAGNVSMSEASFVINSFKK